MSEEVKFKPRKAKNLRVRRNSSDEEADNNEADEDVLWVSIEMHWISEIFIEFSFHRAKLEETKLVQKLRNKQHGVNVVALAIGQKVTSEDLVLKVSKNLPLYWNRMIIE